MDIRRGDIYFVIPSNKFPVTGSEIRQGRPAVVVSADEINKHSDCVTVVYMTTKERKFMPTHFMTCETGTPSTVLCEQINTVSVDRLDGFCGRLTEADIGDLNQCLLAAMELKEYGYDKKPKVDVIEEVEKSNDKTITISLQEYYTLIAERDIYRKLYREDE